MKNSVVLVDKDGRARGTMEKLAAHRAGELHRAFSVFIFNGKGELLLQQRAFDKYHSGGLWSNTCCSHPCLGEKVEDAAHRRLKEEMGMDCKLSEVFQFTYRHVFENGLIEHEYDHVLLGITDTEPESDPEEVANTRYIAIPALLQEVDQIPEQYTFWFRMCLSSTLKYYDQWMQLNM